MQPAGIGLRGLRKRFGAQAVVDGVDLDIRPGEFFSLLGPSGCGKTTTLRMIAGFETPDAGSVHLGPRDVTRVPVHQRDLGMVFQSYALLPHRTVAENVGFGLRMRGVGRAERDARVRAALAQVKLAGMEDRRPAQLSGGQQQRVALARAIVIRPPVLLCDEPLGALDRKLRQAMQIELKALQRELGVTLLFVTHDQEEALAMSDRIAVMNAGRIEQVDGPAGIYQRPATRFVAGFIGDINLVEVTVSGGVARDGAGRSMAAPPARDGRAALAIRPECVMTVTVGSGLLDGTVQDVSFLGDHVLAVVLTGQGERFLLRQRAGGDIRPGQEVGLSWAAAEAVLLPAG